MRFTLLLITFLFSSQYCFAQDWHPFPFNQKKEFIINPDLSPSSYFVDSVEMIGQTEKLIIGGKYYSEPFDSCFTMILDPVSTGWFFCDNWWELTNFYWTHNDVYYYEDNSLIYIIENEFGITLDTVNLAMNLELNEKDTFYLSNNSGIDMVEVACIEQGTAEIVNGYLDDFKIYNFNGYNNGEWVSAFDNLTFRLTKNAGLVNFAKLDYFKGDQSLVPMNIQTLKDNEQFYGEYSSADMFADPIKVGNIYKWEIDIGEGWDYLGHGVARDSVIALDTVVVDLDTAMHVVVARSYYQEVTNLNTGITTISDGEGNSSIPVPISRLNRQKSLNYGYLTELDATGILYESWPFYKIEDEFFTGYRLGSGEKDGFELDDDDCCLFGDFNSGGDPVGIDTYTYSSVTGLNRLSYYDTWTTTDYTLIGFESCDTLFGDVTLVETKEIIPQTIAHLNISPNPSKDIIFINTGSAYQDTAPQTIRIFDINGMEVWSEKRTLEESTQLSVDQLNQGIYTVFIKTADGILTGRFVKL